MKTYDYTQNTNSKDWYYTFTIRFDNATDEYTLSVHNIDNNPTCNKELLRSTQKSVIVQEAKRRIKQGTHHTYVYIDTTAVDQRWDSAIDKPMLGRSFLKLQEPDGTTKEVFEQVISYVNGVPGYRITSPQTHKTIFRPFHEEHTNHPDWYAEWLI